MLLPTRRVVPRRLARSLVRRPPRTDGRCGSSLPGIVDACGSTVRYMVAQPRRWPARDFSCRGDSVGEHGLFFASAIPGPSILPRGSGCVVCVARVCGGERPHGRNAYWCAHRRTLRRLAGPRSSRGNSAVSPPASSRRSIASGLRARRRRHTLPPPPRLARRPMSFHARNWPRGTLDGGLSRSQLGTRERNRDSPSRCVACGMLRFTTSPSRRRPGEGRPRAVRLFFPDARRAAPEVYVAELARGLRGARCRERCGLFRADRARRQRALRPRARSPSPSVRYRSARCSVGDL
jgi:hypothetical protein